MATAIKVAAPRPAPFFTPVFIAVDKGFWADEGLDVTITYGSGSDRLARGEVDYVATAFAEESFLSGADIRMISGHSTLGGAHTLVVRPGIESPDRATELTVAGAEGEHELRDLLMHYNINLDETDIKVTAVPGSHPEQWKLLEQGLGDGGMLGAPWWALATKHDFKSWGSMGDFEKGLPFSSLITTGPKVAKHPNEVRAFVRGYVRAIQYCREEEAGTLEAMMRFSSKWGVETREIAEMVYAANAPYWTADINLEGVAKLMRKAGEKLGKEPAPVKDFVMADFVQEALREKDVR